MECTASAKVAVECERLAAERGEDHLSTVGFDHDGAGGLR
jgi:hypothetical protein